VGLFLIGVLGLSCLSTSIFKQQDQALAQQYIQTIKHRNLVIDLGNGLKTNARLTLPAFGKGPFPGVLLIQGAGAITASPEIAPYLSERGFVVLQYDKRGTIGANHTILDTNVWGNATVNDLTHDAEKALNILTLQPEVDPKRISIIGHSDGTVITPRVAIDNSTKVKNIVLMGIVAQNFRDIVYFQYVNLPLAYATQVLNKNHTGLISIQQIAKDPVLIRNLVPFSISLTNNTNAITNTLAKEFRNSSGYVSIDRQLKPLLIKKYENDTTASNLSKCNDINGCIMWARSEFNLEPNLSIIGNVSKSTGILLLNGENDSQTPVQQAFLLQQRLTEVNHPDHTLITYPNLGHIFYPSSQWSTGFGPFEQYVLADIYAWLEVHSGLSHSYVTTPTASTIANTSSLNTNTISSSSSSKR
jgi:pimeloyl-ACP methyl ester carboxylesterase